MKKNNKGFTLLELLIAVAVLAIIIVPMLRGFVTSHRVNAKSRHLMRATTLAQNEMEIFEKEKLEDLLDSAKFNYNIVTKPDETNVNDPGIYVFEREGIINDDSGMDMFDVRVTLNPERVSASDLYYDQNKNTEVMFMNTVSGVDSATYIQRVRNAVNENGDDEEVYKLYAVRQNPDGITGASWTAEMFGQELERTITLKIEKEDQAGVETNVVKIRYDYTTHYGNVPPEFQNYTTKDKIFFNNAQTLDDEGNPIPLKSVYLYYAPRYNDPSVSGTVPDDRIIIENKDKLPVNVYIIRQNLVKADKKDSYLDMDGLVISTELEPVPVDYQVNVEINEGFGADGKTYGRYFTNLNLDLPGVAGEGKPANFTLTDCDNPERIFSKTEILDYTGMRSLDATETRDRIYTMETAVYEHGADPLTSDPVVRLTGTKIE